MHKKLILAAALALCASVASSAQSPAGASPVALVITLELGDTPTATVPKLVELMKRAAVLAKKEGPAGGVARLYAPSIGGPSNQFAIVVEFPSLTAYAASEVAHAQSADWQKLSADAQAAGFKPVSTTLSTEIKF